MVISILIPVVDRHLAYLSKLLLILEYQTKKIGENIVEIIIQEGETETTGHKRNLLLQKAKGKYVCFIDADDRVSDDYISEILKAVETDCDVVGFEGWMTTNGTNKIHWKISKDLPYDAHVENGVTIYRRFNNHLSPIKREIALKIGFLDLIMGEDYNYAKKLKDSRLINTETYIPKEIYYYEFKTVK